MTDQPCAETAVSFRRATLADREGILAVSAHFANDWIGYVVDRWLPREKGGFVVAETPAGIVAVCAATVEPDGGAWFSAMRVRPDLQNRGVATGLTRFALETCEGWRCRYARLSTATTNKPVHHFIGGKLGFRNLGRWVFQGDITDWAPFAAGPAAPAAPAAPTAPALGAGSRIRPAGPSDLEAVWAFLQEGFRTGRIRPARMIAPPGDPWRLVDFTRDRLAEHIGSGHCFLHEGDRAEIDGLVLAASHPNDPAEGEGPDWSTVSFLDGGGPVAAALLATAFAAIRSDGTVMECELSLPGNQWDTLLSLTKPGWPSGEPSLDAFIYHKDLA